MGLEIAPIHDLAPCFDTTAADDAFKWAAVPRLSDEDGTQLDGRGQPYWNDGCRIDKRFRGAGSRAVRRLGRDDLVESLVAAVRNVGAGKIEYVSGILEVRGILFVFGINPATGSITISDAELVRLAEGQTEELRSFFLDVWKSRMLRAQTAVQGLEATSSAASA